MKVAINQDGNEDIFMFKRPLHWTRVDDGGRESDCVINIRTLGCGLFFLTSKHNH